MGWEQGPRAAEEDEGARCRWRASTPIIELLNDSGVNGLMMKNGYDDLLKNENRDEEPMTENDNDELLIVYCKLAASTAVFISISMMLITELSDLDFH